MENLTIGFNTTQMFSKWEKAFTNNGSALVGNENNGATGCSVKINKSILSGYSKLNVDIETTIKNGSIEGAWIYLGRNKVWDVNYSVSRRTLTFSYTFSSMEDYNYIGGGSFASGRINEGL